MVRVALLKKVTFEEDLVVSELGMQVKCRYLDEENS